MKLHQKIKIVTEVRGRRDTCYYCGAKDNCTRDHFIPKSKGGCLTVWACRVCQKVKADMIPEHFVDFITRSSIFSDEYKKRVSYTINSFYAWLSANNIQYRK